MNIVFERGKEEQPKGHALLYFRSLSDPEELWATYIVVLPITVDVSKYVPPFLINQMGDLGPKDLSAFAFPPSPERIKSYDYLVALASKRDDDILLGGNINGSDVANAIMILNEAVEKYTELYSNLTLDMQTTEELPSETASSLGVNEVLYQLMTDSDKLEELTKLVGRLKFAIEGGEEALANDAEADIQMLARLLPENHQIPKLIEVARASGGEGVRLTDLYLKRCFYLVQEEYVQLGILETEIHELENPT